MSNNNLPTKSGPRDTGTFFTGYYKVGRNVSGQKYDAVMTFFLKRTSGNRQAAESLTATIIAIAQNRGIDPIGLIEQFKTLTKDESFKAALISLINSDRRPTSKLGFAAEPNQNQYVLRNIGK